MCCKHSKPARAATCSSAAPPASWRRPSAAVHAGDAYLHPGIAKRVITDYVQRLDPAEAAGPLSALTAREREVLQLAADGRTVRQIAARLHLSPKTVEHHRAAAMNKLDLHNQTDLVKYAIRIGLTEPWSTT